MKQLKVKDIRREFIDLYGTRNIGGTAENGTIEILNTSFIADDESIFGEVNQEYVNCEIDWYNSQSLNINDMDRDPPKIWKQVADKDGKINSNYGWCVFSAENGYQYLRTITTLLRDPSSRQAVMIYIRPTMHIDAFRNDMHDFMCTYSAQLFIRKDKLHYIVYMRSNDAVFGYKNDRAWHDHVFDKALNDLKKNYPKLEKGDLYWNAASLHVYPRHFDLIS